jgi:hypothetical protein
MIMKQTEAYKKKDKGIKRDKEVITKRFKRRQSVAQKLIDRERERERERSYVDKGFEKRGKQRSKTSREERQIEKKGKQI